MLRLRAIRPTNERIVKIHMHPTHPWLVTADASDHVSVWNWDYRQIIYELKPGGVDERRLVGAKLEKLAEGESEPRGKPTEAIRGGSVKQVSFYDDDVRFWQLWHNQSAAAESPAHVTSTFTSPAPSTKGRHFLVICCENKAIFLDLVTMRGRDVPKQELDNKSLLCMAFLSKAAAADGPLVAFGGSDGVIRVLSMITWKLARRYTGGHKGAISCLMNFMAASGESLLVSGGSDGLLVLWSADNALDSRELVPKLSLKAHDGGIIAVELSRVIGNAPQLITIGADKTLAIWDTVSFKELRRIKPVPKLACHSVASWCHPRVPNLDILTCVKDSHLWAIEHPTYSALTRPLCELSALVPPQFLASHKKLKVYSMVTHPLQPHLVATGTNIGIILCEFDQKSLPPVVALPTPTGSREHTAVYVVERELKLLQFQLSNTTPPALGSNGSLSDTGRFRGEIPEQLHVKQTKKHITTPAPHDSYSVLSVSSSGKYLAIVWPDIPYFSIYKVSDWSVVDSGSARLLAWDTCRDRFALLESALPPRIPVIPKGSSRKAKEAAAAAAQAAAAASATVQVRILLDDGTSNVLMKSVGSRGEPVIGLHGGALLGMAYRTSRRVSPAAATTISTFQSMPLSGFGSSSVSSFSTREDSSQKSAAETVPQNFQLYSWETFQPVGGLLPQPDWTAWDQTVEYCAFAYPQHIVICSLRPQFRYLGDVAIPYATGAVWQRRQLFVATPTTIECVFVDAGVAPIDVETKRRREEMKLKEAQARAVAEHGELALVAVDNQQTNPQERIALRPPMLQVVRLASFQHAPSIPPFLSLPRQSKVDGDASSVLKEMDARKANEVAVGGGGVAVAVTRFPAEQARPEQSVYSMVTHPLQPHLVATGTNIGIILCEFDQKSLPPVVALPTPTGSREHTAVYVVERELKLLQFQLSNTTPPALGSNGSLSDTGRFRGEIPEQLHVKQTKKHITTPAPHDSYSVLSVSSSGKYLAIVWPDIPYFSIYKVSDWSVVDSGSARLLAWDTCRDRFALLESALPPRIPVIPKGSSRKAKEAAAAAAQAAAAASATVQVRILLDDGTSNVLMKSVGSRGEPVIGLHGGALLGMAYRTSRRVSPAAATTISTFQSMPLSGFGSSSVSSFSTREDSSQKSAAETVPQNFQLYSWETFQPVGGLLPQPDWTAWDQTVEYCAFAYPQHIVICSLRPQFRYLGDVAIPYATGAVWQRRQLFVATPTTIECVFVDAGVAPIDVETKRRREEMKLKEAQARAVAEHGELALVAVDNQQTNPQERIALRPPMLQVVRLASFQHAPSIPPFLSLPRQSKVDGDASSVLKEMDARKANEVAVGGGGVAVAVTRFPAEQARPVGPLLIVGVRDGVLWLIDRYMCAHAISLSHPGIRCRCLAAYGDAVSAVKWASRLGREHHDDLAQFMLGMSYATEALHLPGISKRLEFDLALQSNDLKRALQCLLIMSNSRDIGKETLGLDLNDLMNMTKKKENVVEAVQGVVKFAKEFMDLIDAADATAQAEIARETLKRLAAAGSIKGALRGQELRGVALRLANHGELTRLSNLVNNLISVGAGREAAFAAALLGDNVLMEKAWQETGMLAEAVLHAHAHGRPSLRTLVQSWNKTLQKEMEHTPSMKTDAAAAFLASLEGPKLTSLADAAKKPPIEILPPGMASLYGPNPGQAKPLLGKQVLPQPGKPLLLEGSKTTTPIASVPAGSDTTATSESGGPPKSENGASTTPESSNPPVADSGAAPTSDSGAAPATETGAALASETGAAPASETGAAPATETGAAAAESITTRASNSDASVAAESIVPAPLVLNEKPSDNQALVLSTSAAVEPSTTGEIVPSTSARGPTPAPDNTKPNVPDEPLMIDFS